MNALTLARDAQAVLRARYYLRSAETMGPRVRLWGTPSISNFGRIRIGNSVRFYSTVAKLELGVGSHGLLEIAFHHLDPSRRNETPPSQPIVLEDNVWLAARVIVLPGVTVGANTVVGAGSVVTHDLPANVLAAGVPAKVLRPLTTQL